MAISIHAPRVGRDQLPRFAPSSLRNFNPRAPCGARLASGRPPRPFVAFQSTRPVWGATRLSTGDGSNKEISIHAPRVGRDVKHPTGQSNATEISIHAPRVGRDSGLFLRIVPGQNFNPRAPCGARLDATASVFLAIDFNPRAPCGARQGSRTTRMMRTDFNPRAPCGARRAIAAKRSTHICISIHAPRVGRDGKFDDFTPSNLHKRYKRVLARPKNTREKGKIKQKRAYIHAFSAFLGCEGSGTFCALVLRTQYR